jgi:heptosyltransferase II
VFHRKALIVKFGQIGDVIMALPAVKLLHERGFEIHWLCGRAAQPLLECYSWIKLVPVDDKAILRGESWSRAKNIALLWKRVAFKGYDLCATLYYDRRYHLLTLPIQASRKVALSADSRETSLLPGRHHTDEYARILLGLKDTMREHSLLPVRPDRLPPSPLQLKSKSKRIALVPGGTSNVLGEQILRRWPVDSYVTVGRELLNRGWEVLLVGGQEDEWVKPHFRQLAITDCIGTLSLPEVVAVFDSCDAVISHDTGPLHLAGLSTTNLVGIFGPTDPSTRVPRRSSVVGIWGGQGFACRPCYDGRDFAPCEFNDCMHQVAPELVLRELDRLLAERLQGRSTPWRTVCPEGELMPIKGLLAIFGTDIGSRIAAERDADINLDTGSHKTQA